MKASWKLFGGLAVFYAIVTVVYVLIGGEPLGVSGLLVSACWAGMIVF